MNNEIQKQLYDHNFPGMNLGTWKEKPLWHVPNLLELIEACGNKFTILSRSGDAHPEQTRWGASAQYNLDPDEISYFSYGKTPEETVAKLWLKIMENKRK